MFYLFIFILEIFLALILIFCFDYVSRGNSWDFFWEDTCGKLRPVNHLGLGRKFCLKEGFDIEFVKNLTFRRRYTELWYKPPIGEFQSTSEAFLAFKEHPLYLNYNISLLDLKKNEKYSYSLFYQETITFKILGRKSYKKIDQFFYNEQINLSKNKIYLSSNHSFYNLNHNFHNIIKLKKGYDPLFLKTSWNESNSNQFNRIDVAWLGYRVEF